MSTETTEREEPSAQPPADPILVELQGLRSDIAGLSQLLRRMWYKTFASQSDVTALLADEEHAVRAPRLDH